MLWTLIRFKQVYFSCPILPFAESKVINFGAQLWRWTLNILVSRESGWEYANFQSFILVKLSARTNHFISIVSFYNHIK